ncbi:hypothetical protein C8J57DRAFT_1167564 [Mycena rebaudengoi]|nr:hypothetical protein C8J57DRAFT_1167564 [Mycena rebaudengoi]
MSKGLQSFPSTSSSSSRAAQSSSVSTPSFSSPSVSVPGRPPYHGATGAWKVPTNWNLNATVPHASSAPKKARKPKKRTPEEEEITRRIAARVAARLALDHAAVINPNTETPFSDVEDVVHRLLPYHVFLHPKEDLDRKGKGKEKASDVETEIEETKFALECFKRKRKLEERFRRVKTRSGKRPAPDDQAVALAQAVLDTDRADTAWLNSEIRTARAELDRIEREKRANNARLQPPNPATQPQYYRAYPYPYTQQQQPYGQAGGFPLTPSAAGANYPQYPANTAIPVQLPVSSLPTLQALGIQVAATPVEPGAAQPPAVLRGTNGTMLNLEINVSLLQPEQVNGLALILNSLMTRS